MSSDALLRTFPLETELVLRCARTEMNSESAGGLAECLKRAPNWERVLAKAAWHGLTPLLYKHAQGAFAGSAPQPVLERLRTEAQAVVNQNLFLSGLLLKVLEQFEAAGIYAICFKGPALALTAYGQLGLRSFEDVDLFVPPDQALAAQELLESAGYRPFYRLTPFLRSVHARKYTELSFGTAEHPALIDLHWGLVPPAYSFAPAGLPDGKVEFVPLKEIDLPTFPAPQTLRWLCLHGLKHDWARLSWVVDLAELIRARGRELDWQALLDAADCEGHRRMLLLGLLLARDLLGATLPPIVHDTHKSDPCAAQLAERVYGRIRRGDEDRRRPFGISTIYPAAMENAWDRWRYYFNITLAPTGLEWSAVPLPAVLYPLYFLIRPARVLWRFLRARS